MERRRRSLGTRIGFAMSVGFCFLLAQPAVEQSSSLEATSIQFWITNTGDGWKCESCCFTGYCCTVPVAVDC